MNKHLPSLLTSALLLATGQVWRADAADDSALRIHGAVEVEIETERGRSYRLQHSDDLVTWQDVDDAVYGHGGREDRLFSTRRQGQGTNGFFRVVVTEAPTNGLAPWSLAGSTLRLEDRPGGDALQFLTETNGVKAGSATNAFVYSQTRTGPNEVRVETIRTADDSDRRDVYVFTYAGTGTGTWVRDEYRRSQLRDRDVGVFRHEGNATGGTGGSTNPPVVVPTEVPSTLTGLAYTFQSGETPERLEFSTAVGGTEWGDDEANTFTYIHSLLSSNTASITATFRPGEWDEYALSYGTAASGTFVRREFKDNLLADTDQGAFSIVVGTSGGSGTNQPPGSGTMPSGTSLAGFTYTMNDGSPIPIRLVVQSGTAGTQLDDSAPTDFSYTFAVTGANTASLAVRFKPDKWDEYDLTFSGGTNSGSFIRREFDKNALVDTDTGTFVGALTNP